MSDVLLQVTFNIIVDRHYYRHPRINKRSANFDDTTVI